MIRSANDAGAFGYLLKSISAQELVASIRTAMRGLPALSPQAARVLVHDTRTVKPAFMLTERETEVLRLIVQGLSNNEIAARLHLSPFTVKNHVSSLLTKLDASSRTEAAMRAVQSGLITPDG
jgi:DNA-binding NarL/FixJ family response regulator